MQTALVIPAYNEEETIGAVVGTVPPGVVERIIVVDNGSTDRTAALAQEAGAEVVREDRRGYGSACFAGFQTASGADAIVYMDGDGADNPQQIPDLIEPISEGWADLVVGSRVRGHAEPGALLLHARFGNWLASRLMRTLYGLEVSDLGPFRAIRREVLEALELQEMTFGWPTEMMVKAAKRGFRVIEIPVDYRRRAGGKSKVSGTVRGTLLAAYYILGTTIKYACSN
jgi:glycosyltransferase involved in cell wall biosynthesis